MAEADVHASAAPIRFRGGLIDRAIGRLERLPSSAALWIIVAGLVLELVAHAASWIAGETPFGEARPELLFPIPFLVFFLILITVLDGVASSAYQEFRVSLDTTFEESERLGTDLNSIPDIPALIAVLFWTLVLNGVGQDAGEPAVTGTILAAFWFLANAALALLIVHTLRQLRQVARLQAMVARVNLLDPGPINAFSRLTAATAAAILSIGVIFAVVGVSQESSIDLGVEAMFGGIAAAFFFLPLRGMHSRLVAERGRLLGGANARLQLIVDRIHRMIDADDLARVDELQKAQASLLAERDLYLHLSTWPWSTITFRGLASAVMLPIFIGIVLRLLTHVI